MPTRCFSPRRSGPLLALAITAIPLGSALTQPDYYNLELVAAAIVLFVTAVLVATPPPR